MGGVELANGVASKQPEVMGLAINVLRDNPDLVRGGQVVVDQVLSRQDELVNIVANIVKDNPILLDAGHLVVDSLVNAAKAHPVIVKDILARQAQLLEVIVTQHPEVVEQLLTIVTEVLQKQPDVANLLVKALEEGQKLLMNFEVRQEKSLIPIVKVIMIK